MKTKSIICVIILIMVIAGCGQKKKTRVTLEKGAFNVYLGRWKGGYTYYDTDFKKVSSLKITEMIIKVDDKNFEAKGTKTYEDEAERNFTTKFKIQNGLIMKMEREETEFQKMLGSLRADSFVWMHSRKDDFIILKERVTKKQRVISGYEIMKGKVRFIKGKFVRE